MGRDQPSPDKPYNIFLRNSIFLNIFQITSFQTVAFIILKENMMILNVYVYIKHIFKQLTVNS